jgi:acetyltransferase-like isoleucine patch superfamily enzyme
LIFEKILANLFWHFERYHKRLLTERALRQFKRVGKNCHLAWPVYLLGPERITLGDNVRFAPSGRIFTLAGYAGELFDPPGEMIIGDNTSIGHYCHITAARKITIGKGVMIANSCFVADGVHEYKDISLPIGRNPLLRPGEVYIGDESWLGEHACISGNVHMGRHCILGTNAVLMKSIPDYSVAVGAPARVVKRYDSESNTWRRTDADGNFL